MYYPQPGQEGLGLIKAALRSYITADLSAHGLPSVTELLPSGANGVIDEGDLTEDTPTPLVMFATVGDGQDRGGLVRLLLYVLDRGRGLLLIERVLHRLRKRLNTTEVALDYLTFPPGTDLVIQHIEASGSSSSLTLPAWRAEGRALYVFLTVRGFESDF